MPASFARQQLGNLCKQPLCCFQHMLLAHDGFEEHRLSAIDRRRHDRDQRFGRTAKGLIEALQKLSLEPCRERRAGLIDDFANAP